MAKNRTSKSGTPARHSRPEGAGAPTTRGATPRRNSDALRPEDSAGPPQGGYLIPAILGGLVIIALIVYVKTKNRVPAEPASPATATETSGANPTPSNAPAANPTPAPSAAPQGGGSGSGAQGNNPSAPQQNAPVQQEPQNVAVEPTHPEPTTPDPQHGHFTLAQATAGLPAGNSLVADIETSMGAFHCTLLPEQAPTTVANFVGLARGLRDFWDPVAGRWTRRPFYDGSVFHRVIPDFMIQGGDILRSGRGDPGYEIPDENTADHNSAGLLCMANHGPNTGGAQFFITETGRPHLNGSYSVFGRCTPTDLVGRIARVPRSPRDQPITPVYIQHVTIHR